MNRILLITGMILSCWINSIAKNANLQCAVEMSISGADPTCFGEADGWISLFGSGGTPPYQYSLDGTNYQNSGVFNQLVAGTYDGYVKDSNDCTLGFPRLATLNQPDELVITVSIGIGGLNVSATGGTEPYEFSIDGTNFQTSSTFLIDNGTYDFYVRDSQGCTTMTSESIIVADANESNRGIVIFPNPIDTDLRISGLLETTEICIYDLRGQLKMKRKIEPHESVEVSALASGFYIVELNSTIGVRKFRLKKR